jgi:hypothetical protein
VSDEQESLTYALVVDACNVLVTCCCITNYIECHLLMPACERASETGLLSSKCGGSVIYPRVVVKVALTFANLHHFRRAFVMEGCTCRMPTSISTFGPNHDHLTYHHSRRTRQTPWKTRKAHCRGFHFYCNIIIIGNADA